MNLRVVRMAVELSVRVDIGGFGEVEAIVDVLREVAGAQLRVASAWEVPDPRSRSASSRRLRRSDGLDDSSTGGSSKPAIVSRPWFG
jgi:hypothetical protein